MKKIVIAQNVVRELKLNKNNNVQLVLGNCELRFWSNTAVGFIH